MIEFQITGLAIYCRFTLNIDSNITSYKIIISIEDT